MTGAALTKPNQYREMILTAAFQSGEPQHLASCMSIVEILHILFNQVMDHKKDVFILSKGHAALALYAVLADKGEIPTADLKTIGKPNSTLGGHPDRMKVPGAHVSTGSLGNGCGMAVGIALAREIKEKPGMVYCLVGDGEAQEGSFWESLHLACELILENITFIVDANASNFALSGSMFSNPIGVDVWDCQPALLPQVLQKHRKFCPKVVITRTIKGHGIKEMEADAAAWHRRKLTADEYRNFILEVSGVAGSPN